MGTDGVAVRRIAILGSGKIGGTLAPLLAALGHEVTIANSRGPESLAAFLADHPGLNAASVADALAAAELAVLAIPFGRHTDLPPALFAGLAVIDATNYYPARDGQWPSLDDGTTTSSELLARHLPQARLVKAFNTVYFERLRDDGDRTRPVDQRLALPVASDDAAAKQTVIELIDQLGFAAVDAGSLAAGRHQQPGTPVYNVPATSEQVHALLARSAATPPATS